MTKHDIDNENTLSFYKEALIMLNESPFDYMIGGGYALKHFTGIKRESKDIDIFCKPRDFPGILEHFENKGFKTELTDARWLAKVHKGPDFMDVIFDSSNAICTVTDDWFNNAPDGTFEGIPVKFIPPEELFWCKIYVQNRERYDGADLNHLILRYGSSMDWKRILRYMDKHWQLLLSAIMNFQFTYPADYEIIPKWLHDDLISRSSQKYDIPTTKVKVCRGPLIDQTQYEIDIISWDYKVSTMRTV